MQKINYLKLNSRQRETFNFQKVSAVLADYGYATIKLNDDWESADFLAQHIDGTTYLKVQLKSRLTFDKKYIGKKLYICFPYQDKKSNRRDWYLFDHDKLLKAFEREMPFASSPTWQKEGIYHWLPLSVRQLELLEQYKLDETTP